MRTTISVLVSSLWILACVACKGSPDDSGTPNHDTGQLPYPDCLYNDVPPVEVTPAEYGLSAEQIAAFEDVHREHRFPVPWVGGEPGEFVFTLDVDPSKIATFNNGRPECDVLWGPVGSVQFEAPGLRGAQTRSFGKLRPDQTFEGQLQAFFHIVDAWPEETDHHPAVEIEPQTLAYLQEQLPQPAEDMTLSIMSVGQTQWTFHIRGSRASAEPYTGLEVVEYESP